MRVTHDDLKMHVYGPARKSSLAAGFTEKFRNDLRRPTIQNSPEGTWPQNPLAGVLSEPQYIVLRGSARRTKQRSLPTGLIDVLCHLFM